MGGDGTMKLFYGCFDFFFQIFEEIAYSQNPQVQKALIHTNLIIQIVQRNDTKPIWNSVVSQYL